MPESIRRIAYKLYPTPSQAAMLDRVCELHRTLYNAALEERVDAYKKARRAIGYADQCKSLTVIRHDDPEYRRLNASSAQVTLKRLDTAFRNFFRRLSGQQAPGYPRFKSRDRFAGFGFKRHGDGFRFFPGNGWKNGRLRLSGVGTIKARGEARTPGRIMAGNILRKVDGWFLSLVVSCEPRRDRTGDRECGLDWGVESFATLAYGPDEFVQIPNGRFLQAASESLRNQQRQLSQAVRGCGIKRAAKARNRLAKRHRAVANRRKNFLHQTSARLVASHRLIVTEELSIKRMTRSAKGSAENPGRKVTQKAALNRSILDTAPGYWNAMLAYKAEEAGCELIMIAPRLHKPSQTDPITGEVKKKRLSERSHTLPQGRVIGRDQAAAMTILRVGLAMLGREPAWGAIPETSEQIV